MPVHTCVAVVPEMGVGGGGRGGEGVYMPLGRRRVGRWKGEHWFVPFTFWCECPLVVLACESLHVCTVCIWRCEHARFCVDVFYTLYINFHSFIHSLRGCTTGGGYATQVFVVVLVLRILFVCF